MLMALKPHGPGQDQTYRGQHLPGGKRRRQGERYYGLSDETKAYSEGKEMIPHIPPSASLAKHFSIAFNLIPQIDVFLDNLYTKGRDEDGQARPAWRFLTTRRCASRLPRCGCRYTAIQRKRER